MRLILCLFRVVLINILYRGVGIEDNVNLFFVSFGGYMFKIEKIV